MSPQLRVYFYFHYAETFYFGGQPGVDHSGNCGRCPPSVCREHVEEKHQMGNCYSSSVSCVLLEIFLVFTRKTRCSPGVQCHGTP